MPERPNLLFIFTDQQRADTMACYGNSLIETPNLNRLSDESFVFENAYVSAPICSPSRSTIMTGLWPHTSGVLKNNYPLSDSTPVISEMLPPDYISGYYGKWHLGNEVKRQHGFERWVSIEDQYRDYYQESETGSVYSDHYHFLVEHGYEPDRDFEGAKVFSRLFAAKVKEEHTKAMFLADRASEFIHTYRQRPWALYINIFEPHPPYTGPFDDMYDPASIPVAPTFLTPPPENAALMHTLIQRQTEEEEMPESEWNEEGWRRLIARYWGLVTLVDRAVGRILAALEESGQADNTVVAFTSEHGDQLGQHSVLQKAVFYEQSVKVPMLMRVPWLSRENRMVPGRWSHIDLVPTLLDLIGGDIPEHLQGTSRVPCAGRQGDDGRRRRDHRLERQGPGTAPDGPGGRPRAEHPAPGTHRQRRLEDQPQRRRPLRTLRPEHRPVRTGQRVRRPGQPGADPRHGETYTHVAAPNGRYRAVAGGLESPLRRLRTPLLSIFLDPYYVSP